MSFDAAWLDLREPADSESRAGALERLLTGHLRTRTTGTGAIEVVDLGSGTGANLRHLAPRLAAELGRPQHWTQVDADPGLLAAVPEHLRRWAETEDLQAASTDDTLTIRGTALALEVKTVQADLSHDPLPQARCDLLTGSALLDLVSEAWLAALADRLRTLDAAALFALSYDGRIAWHPAVEGDDEIVDLVNRHQRRDKGLGPALGPDAAAQAARTFAAHGLTVESARADWHLAPERQALQQHLHAGWTAAASEMAPHRAEAIQGWLARRMDLLEAGQGHVTVGHLDVLALPVD